MKLSIIIPVLNEEQRIGSCLTRLRNLPCSIHEIIVVDGGSQDNSMQIATPLCDYMYRSPASRALQMNLGAKHATGDFLLFLHADSYFSESISHFLQAYTSNDFIWGRFTIRLSGTSWLFRMIEKCMNLRSRLTGIATGDQAIFINRKLFDQVGGYPELALMEDVAISKCLRKISRPVCPGIEVESSSRRWEENGIIKTILKMWLFRLLYFFEFDTHKLAKYYH